MMKETVFHHFLGIASLLIVFFSHCGDQLLSIWLLTELSTIFLNIRYALYHTGHDSSLLYIVNGLLLTITFVGVRISLSIFTIVRVFIMARADFVHLPLFMTVFIVSVNLSLTVLNINWSIKLVKGAMKVLRKGTKKDKKE
uniref:TLC domain-containing protein n=1 Tax=Palpitomonas bilix TaxID=652834 RepID=A0A7S3DBP1_9EUKA|mmetsp:Transcript_30405/g.78633  ORF Transcript_30405/g.78633 Transcript_30405/m.78633 type:complete len:141 (+) Transcript_30405:466-888(+)